MKKAVFAIAMIVWALALGSCGKEDVNQTENDYNAIKDEVTTDLNSIDKGVPPPPNG